MTCLHQDLPDRLALLGVALEDGNAHEDSPELLERTRFCEAPRTRSIRAILIYPSVGTIRQTAIEF